MRTALPTPESAADLRERLRRQWAAEDAAARALHERLFPAPRASQKAERAACARCASDPNGPSHDGSSACRQAKSIAAGGDVAHCTCAGCF